MEKGERWDHDLIRPLEYGIRYGMTDNDMFYTAAQDAVEVMKLIRDYCVQQQEKKPEELVKQIMNVLQWYQE